MRISIFIVGIIKEAEDMSKHNKHTHEQRQEPAAAEEQVQAGQEDAVPQNEEEIAAEPTAEEKIAALESENAELKDQLLRRAADFDNYRKRMIKEKQEVFDYANASLLADLLDSLDNFDRTVQAAQSATDVQSIADGIAMISRGLVSMLESKYNLSSYGEKGDSFDPEKHEAIGRSEGDVEEPVLAEVYLKGYMLKDRIIRHAKVMVTVPAES